MTTVEQLLARLGSGIESTPGVCGGDPRVAGTRIPVWTLEYTGGSASRKPRSWVPSRRSGRPTWSMPGPMSPTIRDEIKHQIRENEEA